MMKNQEIKLQNLREKVDSRILDAEIFFRNAKLQMKHSRMDPAAVENFHGLLGKAFSQGRPIEVIDGDNDCIDDISLRQVMGWVFNKRKQNNNLFVVSIMGA